MVTKGKDSKLQGPTRLRIGAVSRLTQIPVDTLRAWERRYGVVAPERAGSAARLYGQDDVERLKLIKRLVENGHAIGSVATLQRAGLESLLTQHDAALPDASREGVDVTSAIGFGDTLPPLDAIQSASHGVTLLGQYTSWSEFESAALQNAADALVIDMATLVQERVDAILRLVWRSSAKRTIVLYGFAAAALVQRLAAEGVVPLRSPVSPGQVLRELRRNAARPSVAVEGIRTSPSPRLFADADLAEIAKLSTSIRCECPHHLVAIIRTLAQFELYSAECEHRSDKDKALHATLRASTAQARSLMERSLLTVAEAEGIQLPTRVRDAARAANG